MDIICFVLTLACCFLGGLLFKKLKIPGFMLIGAVTAAALLNIVFDAAYMPPAAKLIAQMIAGAFIGLTIERSDLMRFREVMMEAVLLIAGYLIMNIALGFFIYLLSPLDFMTAMFGAVPGGMSDVPLIAADMGADASKVVVMQFVRMIMGIGIFPGMITRFCRNDVPRSSSAPAAKRITAGQVKSLPVFIITMGVAAICGIAGRKSRIPAGALVFSMVGVMLLKLIWNRCYLPPWSKRLAQLLSGAYIGSSIGIRSVLELRYLVIPVIIVIVGYSLFCFGGSYVLHRIFQMERKEAMLACTPAGASDMALLSLDMGVQSSDLIVLHVIRLLMVSAIFPQIIRLISVCLPL